MILSDIEIRDLCKHHRMIYPFSDIQVRESTEAMISYGLSSYDYDARCAKLRIVTAMASIKASLVSHFQKSNSCAKVKYTK